MLSHKLTVEQIEEVKDRFDVSSIVYLPVELQKLWSNIPPELTSINQYLHKVKGWLEERIEEKDYILIQGEFGAVYTMVQWAFEKKCVPIYATTERKYEESKGPDDHIITNRVFKHIRFRKYEENI